MKNREIKFRAFDIEIGKYLQGEYLLSSVTGRIISLCAVSIDGDCENPNEDIIFEQFTGLKDKNGKEIYEGDILQWTSSWKKWDNDEGKGMVYNNVVEYYVGANYAGWRLRNKSFTKRLTGRSGIINAQAVVIGNIHENPELLNG